MDKGARIRVVKGRKHQDEVGTVFWTGPDKYNEGVTRLGVHADSGETIWVRGDYCIELGPDDAGFEVPHVEVPAKGARVRWTKGEEVGFGTVFWVGEGKGGGMRVGVKDAETEESLWFAARQVVGVDTEVDAGLSDATDDEIPF